MIVGQGLHLVLESKNESGSWIVRPDHDGNDRETTLTLLQKHGRLPCPRTFGAGEDYPAIS